MKKGNVTQKLPLKTKLFYGMGDIYGGGASNIINFYYAVFLTDVVKINPSYSAMIFLISKIWDAITDPLMGTLSDQTKTRFGRRRPYFLLGIPLIIASFCMVWFPVNYDSEKARFIYILIAYMFHNTVYTIIMVPYQAMSAELTNDYEERTNLNSIRMSFSLISSIVSAIVPLIIINSFGQSSAGIRQGYITMSIVFSIFFALPWIGTFLFTKEPVHPSEKKLEKGWIKAMFMPLKIKIFRQFLGLELFIFIGFDIVVLIIGYYMKYWMNNYGAMNILLGILIIFEVAVVPLYTKLSHKKGKITAFKTGAIIWGIACFLVIFIPQNCPLFVLFIIGALIGIGLSGAIVTPYTMFGDVVDVGELIYYRNMSGNFSGMLTFLRKTTTAIAQSTVLFLLGIIGYIEPIEELQNGILVSVQQEQPDAILWTIRIIASFVPILLVFFALRLMKKYPLTKKVHGEIQEVINARDEGSQNDPEIQAKEKALLDLLQ